LLRDFLNLLTLDNEEEDEGLLYLYEELLSKLPNNREAGIKVVKELIPDLTDSEAFYIYSAYVYANVEMTSEAGNKYAMLGMALTGAQMEMYGLMRRISAIKRPAKTPAANTPKGSGSAKPPTQVSGNTTTVYRGDRSSMNPEKVFKEGFTPKGTGDDLLGHVSSNTTPGNYISTSSSKGIAEGFAGKNGYIYEIKTSNYIDVNKSLRVKSPYPEQLELAIPGGVKPGEIKGAYVYKNGVFTEYIPNPNYTGGN
jgi:hypothetical protein